MARTDSVFHERELRVGKGVVHPMLLPPRNQLARRNRPGVKRGLRVRAGQSDFAYLYEVLKEGGD